MNELTKREQISKDLKEGIYIIENQVARSCFDLDHEYERQIMLNQGLIMEALLDLLNPEDTK